jgi:hypothetical protein
LVIKQYRLSDGLYYGEWSICLDERHGRGILVKKNSRYEGYFKNSLVNIKGKFYYENECYYDGEYFCGKLHGYGSVLYNSGAYIGYFKNGTPDGKGKETYTDGGCYKGYFKDGKRHGLGRYKYRSGDIYEGQFLNGQRNGKGEYLLILGIYTGVDKKVVIGDWKDNMLHGEGKNFWPDGDKYEGEFKNDQKEGYGIYEW